jgi:hypothetical protein
VSDSLDTIVVTKDTTYQVVFGIDTFHVAHTDDSHNDVTYQVDSIAGYGGTVRMYITTDAGYLSTWPGGIGVTSDTLDVYVTKDSLVVATSALIPTPPVVTVDPVSISDSILTIHSFSITATNSPTYQWQRKNSGYSWGNISGYASSSMIDTFYLDRNGDSLRCIATNGYGVDTSSAAAEVVLYITPTLDSIISHPRRDSLKNVAKHLDTLWHYGTFGDSTTGVEIWLNSTGTEKCTMVSWSSTVIKSIVPTGSVRGYRRSRIKNKGGVMSTSPTSNNLYIKVPGRY